MNKYASKSWVHPREEFGHNPQNPAELTFHRNGASYLDCLNLSQSCWFYFSSSGRTCPRQSALPTGPMYYLSLNLHRSPGCSPRTQDTPHPLDYGSNVNHFFLSAGAKAFVCDQCGAQFSKEDALETHRQTHTGECP